MKRIDFPFPNELRRQIKTLNSLYQIIVEQKSLLENSDFENLDANRTKFNKISEVIIKSKDRLNTFEKEWNSVDFESLEPEITEVSGLIDQLGDLMHQIIEMEHYNSSILETSQQKIDEIFTKNLSQ